MPQASISKQDALAVYLSHDADNNGLLNQKEFAAAVNDIFSKGYRSIYPYDVQQLVQYAVSSVFQKNTKLELDFNQFWKALRIPAEWVYCYTGHNFSIVP